MVTCCRGWDAKSRRQSRSSALHLDRARDSLRLEGGSVRGTECAAPHVFSECAHRTSLLFFFAQRRSGIVSLAP